MVGFDRENMLGIHPVIEIDVDVGHILNFMHAVVAHPRPFAKPRQFRFAADPAAEAVLTMLPPLG